MICAEISARRSNRNPNCTDVLFLLMEARNKTGETLNDKELANLGDFLDPMLTFLKVAQKLVEILNYSIVAGTPVIGHIYLT
ncbi:MAG: hypothetical protein ACTMUB_08480 [cyanobacterium endosymbiont of Rhopalodia musculus]|uniref:hypothetical protein n=1 Tax=cyanobacterium endosymbiont of Epithemia clementina EcSB TaxID=3034674 RepID=UPI00248089C2|nr:hypothetical protein [cyanobacterium endosymbiont of Epithemia clementina EcSB]WGT68111.1 hypothetical protein P3F56_03275 [cyanobacterium endosymbiont of Epithemia clementina EcSB]